MKRCLVLGAGGFIGKALCRSLNGRYEITAFDRAYSAELEQLNNITQICGDFTTKTDFSDLMQGVDIVFHLISTTLPADETSHIREEILDNVLPTIGLLESMVKCGVRDIIFASSGGTIYGESGDRKNTVDSQLNPIRSYGVQKKVIETYLQFYGRKAV